MRPDAARIDDLLAHMDWVRSLAGALVRDPNEADDLAQQVWVTALQRGPRHSQDLRGWLRRVLFTTHVDRKRPEGRRGRTEELSPEEADPRPSGADLVQQVEAQRDLVLHLLALPEEPRALLLERWFEGVSVREIGRRRGILERTAWGRLDAAHELLRARLDQAWGRRSTWCLAFVPWARVAVERGLRRTLVWSAAGLVLVVSGLWLWLGRAPAGGPRDVALAALPAGAVLEATPAGRGAGGAGLAPEAATGGARAVAADVAWSTLVPAQPIERLLHGRVIDPRGAPVADVEIAALAPGDDVGRERPDEHGAPHLRAPRGTGDLGSDPARWRCAGPRASTRTHADGTFDIAVPHGDWLLELADPTRCLIASGWRDGGECPDFVAVPTREVRGRVVDEAGRPIAGASVVTRANLTWLREARVVLQGGTLGREWRATTDDRGEFRWLAVAAPNDQRMSARAAGYAHAWVDLSTLTGSDPRIVLRRDPEGLPLEARGRIVDELGLPVAGAQTWIAGRMARADREGRFALRFEARGPAVKIAVHAPGRQPRAWSRAPAALDAESNSPGGIVLAVGPIGCVLAGRALDASGSPLAGLRVELLDADPERDHERFRFEVDRASESTDAAGRFRIERLSERAHRLRFVDPRLGWSWTSEPEIARFPAEDAPFEVVIPAPRTLRAVRGIVLGPAGEPIAGASIRRQIDSSAGESLPGLVLTDARGEFTYDEIAERGIVLIVSEGLQDRARVPVTPRAGLERIVVRLTGLITRFAVVDPRARATAFELRRTTGELQPLVQWTADAPALPLRILRDAQGFPLCTAPDGSYDLVLFSDEREVARARIDLRSRAVQEIDVESLPGLLGRAR